MVEYGLQEKLTLHSTVPSEGAESPPVSYTFQGIIPPGRQLLHGLVALPNTHIYPYLQVIYKEGGFCLHDFTVLDTPGAMRVFSVLCEAMIYQHRDPVTRRESTACDVRLSIREIHSVLGFTRTRLYTLLRVLQRGGLVCRKGPNLYMLNPYQVAFMVPKEVYLLCCATWDALHPHWKNSLREGI